MDPVTDHLVEVHPAAMRINYVEPRRHVLLRLTFAADDTWQVRPESLGWREDARGLRTEPTPQERDLILERVVTAMRGHHHLRVYQPGQRVEVAFPPQAAGADDDSPPDGEDTLAADPELQELERYLEDGPMPVASRIPRGGNPADLLAQINVALTQVQPMADVGWEQALSIARQLEWCRGALQREAVEPPPGPFSMGLIATWEFDMYGSQPDLAALINEIERAMNARLRG